MTDTFNAHYDCDPGQDDAVALLYALGSASINIQSISAVGGNVDVVQCARNAQQILELAGRQDIPVFIGAEKPLKRALKTLPHVFGVTGMAGAEDLPLPSREALPLDNQMPTLSQGKMLIATGPLTNIAKAVQSDAHYASTIDHLVIMGGCPYSEPIHNIMGNFKPDGADDVAEYNFACDPDAAQIVFRAGFKRITLVGLNVTRAVLYGQDIDAALRATGKRCAIKAADILAAVGEEDQEDYLDLKQSPADPVRAMHDVLAMACIDAPELFTFEDVPIRIMNEAPPAAAGQSLIDHTHPDHKSVRVATKVDGATFLNKMVTNIANLS
jgi:purine nucleosidase